MTRETQSIEYKQMNLSPPCMKNCCRDTRLWVSLGWGVPRCHASHDPLYPRLVKEKSPKVLSKTTRPKARSHFLHVLKQEQGQGQGQGQKGL